jgi:hypothetical protein
LEIVLIFKHWDVTSPLVTLDLFNVAQRCTELFLFPLFVLISEVDVPFPVNVPQDAYIMDFVFSESEEGGIFDNRNGLDYHIPVFGATAKEPPMHIVHIAVEMAPIAKVIHMSE